MPFTAHERGGKSWFLIDLIEAESLSPLEPPRMTALSPVLREGKTELKFNFTATKAFGGKGELYVNGEKVDEVDMPNMHRSTYSLAETFDVGVDLSDTMVERSDTTGTRL
jgi:hypothetical protein